MNGSATSPGRSFVRLLSLTLLVAVLTVLVWSRSKSDALATSVEAARSAEVAAEAYPAGAADAGSADAGSADVARAGGVSRSAGGGLGGSDEPNRIGAAIWSADCAVCHGPTGQGTFRAPPINDRGTAAVDFVLRTGRMPPADITFNSTWWAPAPAMHRGEPAYDEAQIEALVAYTDQFVNGPSAPGPIDLAGADLAKGAETYLLNCASCHQMAGQGGALAYGIVAPELAPATPRETVEAIRTGPGSMPPFSRGVLTEEQVRDLTAYVDYLDDPKDRGGLGLWHLGPVPEGLVAWLVGIGAMILLARWLGQRSPLHGE